MSKRTSQEIKKKILTILSQEIQCTYAQLERKTNTGFRTVVQNCKELEKFNAVEINEHKKHEANARPYYVVLITNIGRDILKRL